MCNLFSKTDVHSFSSWPPEGALHVTRRSLPDHHIIGLAGRTGTRCKPIYTITAGFLSESFLFSQIFSIYFCIKI